MNLLRPTMKLHWKSYKTEEEGNEGEGSEDVVWWGRHLNRETQYRPGSIIIYRERNKVQGMDTILEQSSFFCIISVCQNLTRQLEGPVQLSLKCLYQTSKKVAISICTY